MRGKRYKAKPLAAQLFALKSRYPDSKGTVSPQLLKWECRLRPQPTTETYLIQIEYQLHERPQVYVSEGRLIDEEDLERVPHKFEVLPGKRVYVCLDKHDWSSDLFLADSVVLWAMEWALYYELWLATGKWLGTEAPHE